MVQWQTLDTTTADIWIPMQVISNAKRKVWVFPRKNPLQIARHGGPLPMTMIIPTDNADRFDERNSTSIDSWAGMKSPQKWGPSLLHYPGAAMRVFPMPGMIMIPAMADSSTPFFFHRNKRYPSPCNDFHNNFPTAKVQLKESKNCTEYRIISAGQRFWTVTFHSATGCMNVICVQSMILYVCLLSHCIERVKSNQPSFVKTQLTSTYFPKEGERQYSNFDMIFDFHLYL